MHRSDKEPSDGRTRRERGATAVEYALMVGLIAIGIISAVTFLKDKTTDALTTSGNTMSGIVMPAKVTAGATFSVRYTNADVGSFAWAGIGAPGWVTTGYSSWGYVTNGAGNSFVTATLTAPATAGTYEVQIHKDNGANHDVSIASAKIRVV